MAITCCNFLVLKYVNEKISIIRTYSTNFLFCFHLEKVKYLKSLTYALKTINIEIIYRKSY